ncbi:hypothetical protein AGMMS49965_03680 [Bacteroidia bacterium]|nr:hypothetical protein AGMMS49965_03680 [Bacteroidia bacterium]
MNDNIEEYLERGEINYLGRPDLAYTQTGNGRINIGWFVNDDPRIDGSTITWNNQDNEPQSAPFPVDRSALVDGYMSVMLSLDEGTYVFRIVHTGEKGYPSIATEVSGSVSGPNYISTLSPRRINAVTSYNDRVEIDWAVADANVMKVLLTYETASGPEKTIEIEPSEQKTILTDYKPQGKYSWITNIQEANAFEGVSIPSDSKTFPDVKAVEFDKSAWNIASFSDASGEGGGVEKIIDGNTTDGYWHSNYDNGAPLPHWAIIDMQSPRNITKIDTYRRNNGDTKTVQYFISDDPDPDSPFWVLIAEGDDWTDHVQTHDVSDVTTSKRYLKINLPDSNREVHTAVMEVNVFGFE